MKPFYLSKIYFCLLLLSFVHFLTAQSCLNDFRYITRQSELDSIAISNPGCKEITGFMIIDGPGIVSLEPFKQFTKVDALKFSNCINLNSLVGLDSVRTAISISIENSGLTALDGLLNLDSIVTLSIIKNAFLQELKIPVNLKHAASIRINNNILLENIRGKSGFVSIGSLIISANDSLAQILDFGDIHVGVSINITNNPKLISIQGLNKVKSIADNLFINNNASLRYLPNFDSLTIIGGNFLLEGIDPPQGTLKDSILQNIPTFPILKSIGGNISISGLHGIKEINGFENLRSVGGFLISGTIRLAKINAFKSLEKITGNFNLSSNSNLISVIGFNILKETQGLSISKNNKLELLAGFNSLERIESFSFTSQVALKSLTNFKNLKTVDDQFIIEGNGSLEEIDFSSLERIGTPGSETRLVLATNRNLKSLSSFRNLKEVYGRLVVSDLWAIGTLDGLHNIDYKNLFDVRLQNNLNLYNNCAVKSICDYILLGGKTFGAINTNGIGCNTLEEIRAQCVVSTSDLPLHHDLIILYPNPASQQIQVTSKDQKTITNILISTVDGMVLDLGRDINDNQVDISSLIPGLYVLSCQVGGIAVQKPFIKVE